MAAAAAAAIAEAAEMTGGAWPGARNMAAAAAAWDWMDCGVAKAKFGLKNKQQSLSLVYGIDIWPACNSA